MLIRLLLDPLVLFWLAMLSGLLLASRRRTRAARRVFGGASAWLFLITVSPLPVWLAARHEARYPVLWEMPDTLTAPYILVLGGGHTNAPGLPPGNQLSTTALARLAEGIRLYRDCPGGKLLGSGHSRSGRVSQGEMLMRAALSLGVPPEDTLWLPTPANTEQEACAFAARFGPGRPLVVATDALHQPRAMFWFRQAGLSPIPAPANHRVKPDPQRSPYNWRPSAQKLELSKMLIHEWCGQAWGRLKTRLRSKNPECPSSN
jgi:uncharacterized SAM-binding protein YcdF (DUF218 family)